MSFIIDKSGMDGFERNENLKIKTNEASTFTVPFTIDEMNINHTKTCEISNDLSKEKIMSQAFSYHSAGKFEEAAKYYQYFLDQGFLDVKVFSNYGFILKDLGKLEEAEFYMRKAIQLKPDFAELYSNLGIILKDLGKFKDAEFFTRRSMELKPSLVQAYGNLADILLQMGQANEAMLWIKKMLKIRPWSIKALHIFNHISEIESIS